MLKRGTACLMIFALLCSILLTSGAQAADVDTDIESGITLEVTIKTDNGEEVRTVSGENLRKALYSNGIKRGDITCMKITGGAVKTTDWDEICYKGNTEDDADTSYMNLTSILAEEGVKGEDISDRTSGQTFPKSLKTVILPVGVTRIGASAFNQCSSLQEIIIPEGVTEIGNYAFYQCSNLQEIIIPEGVTEIGNYAFQQCSSLQEIVIPEGVTEISGDCFRQCENLQKVTLPESLRSIFFSAFRDCGNLQEINFPNGVTLISSYAFYGCKSLQKADLPETITTIGEHTFENCSSLKSIIIPKAVSKLGMSAFEKCTSLEEVEIWGSAKLEASTFLGCSRLKEVTLLNGLILDCEDPPSYRNPAFCGIFTSCPLKILNIVLKEGETAANMTPVTCMQTGAFGVDFSRLDSSAIFFYLPDGTLLSEDTTPALDEVAERYLSEDDGNTEDNSWHGWEIGRSYEIEYRLTNLSTSNESTVWKSPEGNYTACLSGKGDSGKLYELPKTIQVTIGDKEAVQEEDYTYDPATGELVIFKDSIIGKIVVTAQGSVIYHDVTVRTQGGGRTKIQTSLVSVSSDGNSKVRVQGGDDILFTFLPVEGCSLISLTVDGETVEATDNTYKIPIIKSDHTILVTFTEKIQPTPEPTPTPVVTPTPEPPGPTETPVPTEAPAPSATPVITETPAPSITPEPMPSQEPVPSQKPTPSPVPTPEASQTPLPDKDLSDITDGLGVSPDTAVKIQTAAKELDVPMDTILVTEQTIQSQKTDQDIKGAYFARIQARASQITERNIKLTWNRVKGADGYEVYGNRCNTKKWIYEYKLKKNIKNGNKKSYIDRKCKKGTYFKYIVRAYKIIDGKKVTIAASKTIHVTTKGGKNGNAKSVKVNKNKVILKVGKTWRIKAKEIKESKPLRHHREVSYESSCPQALSVSRKGVLKAKKKGKYAVFAYAQSGVYKKIQIAIK